MEAEDGEEEPGDASWVTFPPQLLATSPPSHHPNLQPPSQGRSSPAGARGHLPHPATLLLHRSQRLGDPSWAASPHAGGLGAGSGVPTTAPQWEQPPRAMPGAGRGAALSPLGTVKCLSTSASSLLGEGIGHKQTGPEAGEAARRASLPPPPPKSRPFPASKGKGMEEGGGRKDLGGRN